VRVVVGDACVIMESLLCIHYSLLDLMEINNVACMLEHWIFVSWPTCICFEIYTHSGR
jgi:hypothetical protein